MVDEVKEKIRDHKIIEHRSASVKNRWSSEKRISDFIKEEQNEIDELKKQAETNEDVHEKEALYTEVDTKEKDIAKQDQKRNSFANFTGSDFR